MTKQAIKTIEKSGTKVTKDKLMDAIKRANDKEFMFAKDTASGYSVVLIKLGQAMQTSERFVLELREFKPTIQKQNLIEMIQQMDQCEFLIDVDLERMMMIIAIPCL